MALFFSLAHNTTGILLINFVYHLLVGRLQEDRFFFLTFADSYIKYHLHSRIVPGTDLESNKYLLNAFQACGQKHGGGREHLFREMMWPKCIVYALKEKTRLEK